MPPYCIGIDFGTLSARALLVDARTGRELSSGVCDYPHGVMESALPSGEKLGFGWALQDPADYLFALEKSVALALRDAPGCAGDVIGIGIDATACTLLPVTKDGTPLCSFPEYAGVPHAYAKLWQHNAPQRYADRMTELAARRREPWLFRCGGRVDAQWAVPKLWQALEEAPDVYEAADAWIEAGDWLVWKLCGRKARSASTAGYKALHSKQSGYPSEDYFAALHPGLASVMRDKLSGDVLPVGSKAGELLADMAKRLGLSPGIAVAVSLIDAHACMMGCGITSPGTMLYIAGTSGCHLVLGEDERPVPGICGVVEDGMMPGLFGYEAGQSCVGDAYAWLTERLAPESYAKAAREQGISLHSYLTGLAQRQKPGQSGLLALDFWRGNRSILSDSDLSGLILGLTPASRVEDIYRAMLEATAFGTRVIIENYREHGVRVERFAATGGISRKNPLLMQILADVCGMPVEIAAATQSGALGSAIFAAAAAGSMHGGWDSAEEAASHMAPGCEMVYHPISEHSAVYDRLYSEYRHLYDYFGRGENDVMKRLSALKRDAQREHEGAWHD